MQHCCYLVTKSCLTLCNLMDWSPPSSSIHGIFQARIMECVAISFSRGSSWPRNQTHVSCIGRQVFTTESAGKPYYVPYERKWKVKVLVAQLCLTFCDHVESSPPLSVGFSRQEHWSGLPFPSPGALPNPGIEPRSPALWADSLPSEPPYKESPYMQYCKI